MQCKLKRCYCFTKKNNIYCKDHNTILGRVKYLLKRIKLTILGK